MEDPERSSTSTPAGRAISGRRFSTMGPPDAIARRRRTVSTEAALLGLLALLALVVGLELVRPWHGAGIAFDSQVSVLHFDRLLTGRQMQERTTTTAKPLISIVFGLLHHSTGGWHAISYATIAAYAVGTAATGVLAFRVAGPLAAGFAAIGTAMSLRLLFDTGLSLATPWALPLWAGAGLAVTAPRPRYVLAGVLLAAATLARLETGLVAGTAIAVLIVSRAVGRSVPGGAWLVPLVALAAVPAQLLHDLLLTGDPLRWTRVAVMFSEANEGAVMTPREVIGAIWTRWSTDQVLTLLAVLGLVRLAAQRRWPLLVGVVALGPVVLIALIAMAARGIYVDNRYFAAPELAGTFAAAVGLTGVRVSGTGWRAWRWRPWLEGLRCSRSVVPLLGGVLAMVIVQPYWWQDPQLRGTVRRVGSVGRETDRALPVLRAVMTGPVDPALARGLPPIVVPATVRFRTVIDLQTAESSVGGLQPARFSLPGHAPAVGQVLMHHRLAVGPGTPLTILETTRTVEVEGIRLEPILTDDVSGLFVVRVARADATQ